jgi:hypothetical protein
MTRFTTSNLTQKTSQGWPAAESKRVDLKDLKKRMQCQDMSGGREKNAERSGKKTT